MGQQPRRPLPVRNRMLPPDVTSLETMFRQLHVELTAVATHCKINQHDRNSQAAFQRLHLQRSQAWETICNQAPELAMALCGELGIRYRLPEVSL